MVLVGVGGDAIPEIPTPSIGLAPLEGGLRENGDGGIKEGLGMACNFVLRRIVSECRDPPSA